MERQQPDRYRLNQAFSCPGSSLTGAKGELDPIYCPIFYCTGDHRNGIGNYTASACIKFTAPPDSNYFYEKICYNYVCDHSCAVYNDHDTVKIITDKYKAGFQNIDKYNVTISVACRTGDFRGVDNQTTIFPNSTIKTFTGTLTMKNGVAAVSPSNRLQVNFFLPLFMLFIFLLTRSVFSKRF